MAIWERAMRVGAGWCRLSKKGLADGVGGSRVFPGLRWSRAAHSMCDTDTVCSRRFHGAALAWENPGSGRGGAGCGGRGDAPLALAALAMCSRWWRRPCRLPVAVAVQGSAVQCSAAVAALVALADAAAALMAMAMILAAPSVPSGEYSNRWKHSLAAEDVKSNRVAAGWRGTLGGCMGGCSCGFGIPLLPRSWRWPSLPAAGWSAPGGWLPRLLRLCPPPAGAILPWPRSHHSRVTPQHHGPSGESTSACSAVPVPLGPALGQAAPSRRCSCAGLLSSCSSHALLGAPAGA